MNLLNFLVKRTKAFKSLESKVNAINEANNSIAGHVKKTTTELSVTLGYMIREPRYKSFKRAVGGLNVFAHICEFDRRVKPMRVSWSYLYRVPTAADPSRYTVKRISEEDLFKLVKRQKSTKSFSKTVSK